MQDLRITLIQTNLYWENTIANLAMLEEKIHTLESLTDLIVLPEMFNSGFSQNVKQTAEPMNLTTHRWMRQMAAQTDAVITGSFAVKEGDKFVNRLLWVEPDGTTSFYDKRHLYRMGFENEHFTAGSERIIRNWRGWNICPLICYDLRFPVWSRNVNLEYDLLLYVASWPAQRNHVWQSLLTARALENLSYVAGINRIGTDGNDIEHIGGTVLYDFKGIAQNSANAQESILQFTLAKSELTRFREKFPAHLDADGFKIN
jgi:predicted amidohydrolase